MDPKQKDQDKAGSICKEFEQVAGNRGVWETHWEEIAARVWPSMSRSFLSRGARQPGEKRNQEIFDSTAALGLNRLSAILDSLLTPRNQKWHRLTSNDAVLMKDRQTKLWFEEATRILFEFRYAPRANFSSQNQQNYKSLGGFGTGCLFIDALQNEPGIRYKAIHLGEVYFLENHQGIIDRALRRFPLTARQAVQKWGMDKVPDQIRTSLETAPEKEFFFIHKVEPREEFDPNKKNFKGMPWASFYVSVEGKALLSEGGYNTFPYAISRYEQSAGEVYGRSPAMDALPAIKTLNEQKKTLLKQGHRAVDPVLLAADDGIVDAFSLAPGAINSGGVSMEGRPLVHALPVGNIAAGKEMMEEERNLINNFFLVSLFQILTETPQMTATEVMERVREKGILLGPTIGRQQSEYLGPMIERELDILMRQRLLPPMPPALREAQGQYKIIYDSPLTRAQRAEEAAGLMRTMETTLNIVNVTGNPDPLDWFDWDTIMPEISDIQGVPLKWLKSLDDVMAARANRQQQMQQQQAIQAGPAAAAMIKASAVANKGQV